MDNTNNNKAERLFLSVDEVAKMLGASKSYVYQQVRDGAIPSKRLGKRVFVPVSFIRDFVAEVEAS